MAKKSVFQWISNLISRGERCEKCKCRIKDHHFYNVYRGDPPKQLHNEQYLKCLNCECNYYRAIDE